MALMLIVSAIIFFHLCWYLLSWRKARRFALPVSLYLDLEKEFLESCRLDNIFPQDYVEQIYKRLTCPKHFLLLKEWEHLVLTNQAGEIAPATAAGWLSATMEMA